MKRRDKAMIAAIALAFAGTSGAAIKKLDLEYSFSVGWDLIGKLRACAAFDASRDYYLASADVEKELLKFVRRSDMLKDDYPEVQASKVAIQAMINASSLAGTVLVESKEAAASQCQLAAQTEGPNFVKLLRDIAAGRRNIK